MKYFTKEIVETAKKQLDKRIKEERNIFDALPVEQKKTFTHKFIVDNKVMKDNHLFLGDLAIYEKVAFANQFMTDQVLSEIIKTQPFQFHMGGFIEKSVNGINASIAQICNRIQQNNDSYNRKIADIVAKIANIDKFLEGITKTICEIRDKEETPAVVVAPPVVAPPVVAPPAVVVEQPTA